MDVAFKHHQDTRAPLAQQRVLSLASWVRRDEEWVKRFELTYTSPTSVQWFIDGREYSAEPKDGFRLLDPGCLVWRQPQAPTATELSSSLVSSATPKYGDPLCEKPLRRGEDERSPLMELGDKLAKRAAGVSPGSSGDANSLYNPSSVVDRCGYLATSVHVATDAEPSQPSIDKSEKQSPLAAVVAVGEEQIAPETSVDETMRAAPAPTDLYQDIDVAVHPSVAVDCVDDAETLPNEATLEGVPSVVRQPFASVPMVDVGATRSMLGREDSAERTSDNSKKSIPYIPPLAFGSIPTRVTPTRVAPKNGGMKVSVDIPCLQMNRKDDVEDSDEDPVESSRIGSKNVFGSCSSAAPMPSGMKVLMNRVTEWFGIEAAREADEQEKLSPGRYKIVGVRLLSRRARKIQNSWGSSNELGEIVDHLVEGSLVDIVEIKDAPKAGLVHGRMEDGLWIRMAFTGSGHDLVTKVWAQKVTIVTQLKDMGYSESQAKEAARRCSSIEAAVDFLTIRIAS